MTKRKKFSETAVLATVQILLYRLGVSIPCFRCEQPLFTPVEKDGVVCDAMPVDKIEREHFHELALGGIDAPVNCVYSHKRCHAIATNGTGATTAGSSKHKIAKVRRIQAGGRKRKGPPMKSRGFQKGLTRKFSGKVVKKNG